MEVITKDEFALQKEAFMSRVEEGELFIYPTDTIYGLGCDATNEVAVYKLRNAKKIPMRPLSVIAPSKEWIIENFEINDEAKQWLNKLPGPYTLILKIKNKSAVSHNISDTDSVGVRMPDHIITEFVQDLGIPIVTTSANITNKSFMTNIDYLDEELKNNVGFFIDEGEISGSPSNIIFLDKKEVTIRKR
ncbi:threonylcarbamoyl-AMP synthase [Candidatus Woesearchaeota archaeon]|nr:threonylcarbamoyl-AMP synthase [Candidatus Woesearchaeota archaeon]